VIELVSKVEPLETREARPAFSGRSVPARRIAVFESQSGYVLNESIHQAMLSRDPSDMTVVVLNGHYPSAAELMDIRSALRSHHVVFDAHEKRPAAGSSTGVSDWTGGLSFVAFDSLSWVRMRGFREGLVGAQSVADFIIRAEEVGLIAHLMRGGGERKTKGRRGLRSGNMVSEMSEARFWSVRPAPVRFIYFAAAFARVAATDPKAMPAVAKEALEARKFGRTVRFLENSGK
jgi:hypothetical protein